MTGKLEKMRSTLEKMEKIVSGMKETETRRKLQEIIKEMKEVLSTYEEELKNAVIIKDAALEKIISRKMRELCITPKTKGYDYIKESVIILVRSSNADDLLVKSLYVEIAKRFDASYGKVERAIRYAIERISLKGINLFEYFGYEKLIDRKMTNREFLSNLATKIKEEEELI